MCATQKSHLWWNIERSDKGDSSTHAVISGFIHAVTHALRLRREWIYSGDRFRRPNFCESSNFHEFCKSLVTWNGYECYAIHTIWSKARWSKGISIVCEPWIWIYMCLAIHATSYWSWSRTIGFLDGAWHGRCQISQFTSKAFQNLLRILGNSFWDHIFEARRGYVCDKTYR